MKILFIVFTLSFSNLFACRSLFDCSIGSRCEKPPGSQLGVCKGGMNPGNIHDKKPVKKIGDMTGKYGDKCSYDLDCGIGGKCAKEGPGSLYGTCI